MSSAHLRAAPAALAAILLLASCGGGSGKDAPRGADRFTLASRLQSADCTGWKRASHRERVDAVERLEEVARGPHGEGATIPDDLAYETIDRRCKNYYARGFLLYEMYNRAASFQQR